MTLSQKGCWRRPPGHRLGGHHSTDTKLEPRPLFSIFKLTPRLTKTIVSMAGAVTQLVKVKSLTAQSTALHCSIDFHSTESTSFFMCADHCRDLPWGCSWHHNRVSDEETSRTRKLVLQSRLGTHAHDLRHPMRTATASSESSCAGNGLHGLRVFVRRIHLEKTSCQSNALVPTTSMQVAGSPVLQT